MGRPANCCLFGSLRNNPLGSHGPAALYAFRGACRPGRAKRCPTLWDTIPPESAPLQTNDVFPIVLNLISLNYWLDSVRRFATLVSKVNPNARWNIPRSRANRIDK